jgi:predicted SAM-dependent methyltransferase
MLRSLARQVLRRPEPGPNLALYDACAAESLSRRLFYNVGAGDFYHPYWTNLDHATASYAASQRAPFQEYNLVTDAALPIAPGTAEAIYSSHVIEHVGDAAVARFLENARRALKPGGVCRITCPDIELFDEAFRRRDRHFFYWTEWYRHAASWQQVYTMPLTEATLPQLFLHKFASPLCTYDIDANGGVKCSDAEVIDTFARLPLTDALDVFCRRCAFVDAHPSHHINWWTATKLSEALRTAGFTRIRRSGFGQSLFPPLRDTRYFDSTHPAISVYVEAFAD